MLSLGTFAALQSEADLLQSLAANDLSAANTLPLLTRLRKTYPPDVAGAALETARLREKAAPKFSRASQMFFTADALEQATSEIVAEHHARILAPYHQIADLGCGIGGDAILLGQRAWVLGVDLDLLRLRMARHNAAVYQAGVQFLQADLTAPLPLVDQGAAFFDPVRRTADKRIFSVRAYTPPLELIQTWNFQAVLVKISPGVQLEELTHLDAGIEFVSLGGELKEALLHIGELAFRGFRATRLPENITLVSLGLEPPPVIDAPLRYLYEPDPAVIRSGLFGEMLQQTGITAYRLDETIAYLTGDEPTNSPWLRSWRIDAWMPFNLKKLRRELVEQGVGKITVKKRGSPITPEALQAKLSLKDGIHHAVVILTRLQGQPIVLISYP
jgi:SAM-dependent methyltransferase